MKRSELKEARDTAGVKLINVFCELNKSGHFRDFQLLEFEKLCDLHAVICRQLDQEEREQGITLQEVRELISQLGDISSRIGGACTPQWAREEIERVTRQLQFRVNRT